METCETVKVEANNEQGFCLINECDFIDGKHKMFVAKKKRATKKKAVK